MWRPKQHAATTTATDAAAAADSSEITQKFICCRVARNGKYFSCSSPPAVERRPVGLLAGCRLKKLRPFNNEIQMQPCKKKECKRVAAKKNWVKIKSQPRYESKFKRCIFLNSKFHSIFSSVFLCVFLCDDVGVQCLLVCADFRHTASQTSRHGAHFTLPGTVGCHRRYASLISFLFYMQQMSDTFNCIILLVSTSSFAYFGARCALALKCFCEFFRWWKIEFVSGLGFLAALINEMFAVA